MHFPTDHPTRPLLFGFLPAHGPLALLECAAGQRIQVEPHGIPCIIERKPHFIGQRFEDKARHGRVRHLSDNAEGGINVLVHPKGGQVFVGVADAGHGRVNTPGSAEVQSLKFLISQRRFLL